MSEKNSPQMRFAMTGIEFSRMTELIEQRTGLLFSQEKQREFQLKLEKLPPNCVPSRPGELIDELSVSDDVLQKVVNVLTVGESYFFRNHPHFSALGTKVLPALIEAAKDARVLNIWCAGCACGEEPYSIAVLLNDEFPQLKDWNITLTATDINTDFLARARTGVFRKWSFRGDDDAVLRRHFKKNEDGDYLLDEDIRRRVVFKHFNLFDMLSGALPVAPHLDLLLCRNVLIYFSFQTADRIASAYREMLRPGGYLFLGHSEAFPSLASFEAVHSNATYYYRRHVKEPDRRLPARVSTTASIPGFAVSTSSVPVSFDEHGTDIEARIRESANLLDTARSLADSGNTAEALALLDNNADSELQLDYRTHFLSALIADHAGCVMRAMESMKRAVFLEKDFIVGHYYLGILCRREGDFSAAERYLKNALRLLDELPGEAQLDEADGLTAGSLEEIVSNLLAETTLQRVD